jgi:hypothetical protein
MAESLIWNDLHIYFSIVTLFENWQFSLEQSKREKLPGPLVKKGGGANVKNLKKRVPK